ncbi:hypothetical protein E4U57_004942 [Claviceps arundinis]|uniref:Uncharacterized protein n=1 Tax=Claviceps arundinis TaxID=1623583 RepID=A0A9P7SSU0_9HYPO|nr:hypothetical protein E4U57_004942 [Claviceps arundinis]KAG5972251.1 hypothetical protein E4U56_006136 [Claviceps arundinis]
MVVYCVIAYILYWTSKLPASIPRRLDASWALYNALAAIFIWCFETPIDCDPLKNTDNKAEFLQAVYQKSSPEQFKLVKNTDRATCVENERIMKLMIGLFILFVASSTKLMSLRHRQMDN